LFRVPLEEFLRHILRNNQKKLKKIIFSTNFEQIGSGGFSRFFQFLKKHVFANFPANFSDIFLVVSRALRRVFKTFSVQNSKIRKKLYLCQNLEQFFFEGDFFRFFGSTSGAV